MPNMSVDHFNAGLRYITFVVGHEGENSLLKYLNDFGYAEELGSIYDN